ncbi:disease resistance protein RGA2-like [Typha angustifolia]|uniref:disease resistance protein RGA2-like n=1 Tax=Typha angustifolia TaxID=59011 RepID=UPI003C2EEFF9
MAEMLGSAIVGELANKAASFLIGNYEMQAAVKDKLERLQQLLIMIQSAVEAVEGRQIKNSSLLRWLRWFKDAAYDADDVLDTFEYRILEQKANDGGGEVSSSFASSSSNAAKRVRTAARSLFSCDEDVKELSSVVEKLERSAAVVGNFLKLLELDESSKKPELFTSSRITSSLLPEVPIGRDTEKEHIIDLLLQSESSAVGNVSVIPILGIGGVGKTTLAQLVCEDERVKQHFSLIMWVCVSDTFDVVKLTREIFEQSHRNRSHGDIENFNSLQLILEEKLRSERFLLVLDDVWNEKERTAWEKLRTPLLCGKEGSKIIVTSRLEKVAKLMGTMDPIGLQGLPEDEFWSFLKKCAFNNIADPEEHPGLLVIGKEIAKRLKGSPLAAKTLGALLKDDLSDEHWQGILKSDIWELVQGEDDIIPVLRLSYGHLPVHLQRCFAYCSLFPKDWQFQRDDLIYMWMAEGLVHNTNHNRRPEDVGRDYFDDLISKAFFEPFSFWNQAYKIHDLLHDLAESVSKDVYYRINGNEPKKIPDSVRHLSVMTTNLAELTEYSSILKHLRTLNFLCKSKSDLNVADLRDVLEKLKCIRVLNFVNCHLEVLPLSSTCDLIHLRFLNLGGSGIKILPDELCRLYHLEMLILWGSELDRIPASMNKLINLHHLIEENQGRSQQGPNLLEEDKPDKSIVSTISGIGKLTRLQELKIFYVGKTGGFEIGQLKTLSKLRGSLQIRNLENVGSKEEAMEARLSDKGSVVKLELSWCDTTRNVRCDVEEEVLEGLQLHPHLKELKIVGNSGVRSPSWLMKNHYLKNLVKLELHGCAKWKELPPLGQLPSLETLELRGMHAIEEVGRGFYGSGVVKGFPSLETLVLRDFPELKEWFAIEDKQLLPRIKIIGIHHCSKLMALPSLPPTLKQLDLRRVGITLLPAFRRLICPSLAFPSSSSPSFLSRLSILNCPNLENIDEWSEQDREKLSQLQELGISCGPSIYLLPPSLEYLWINDNGIEDVELSKCMQHDLPSLKTLGIIRCPHITALPSTDVLERFTKLFYLSIKNCGELRSIGGLRALVSLNFLSVFGCPKLTSLGVDQAEQVMEEEMGLSSVSNLHLTIDNPLLFKVLLSKEGLTFLSGSTVKGGNELTTFTAEMDEAFQHLTSLEWLNIKDCNSLQSLPMLPSSLRRLRVENCHPALKYRYREGGPDRRTIAHIPFITIL